MEKEKLALLLIRIGLVFVLIYAAASATITPANWIGYFPPFTRGIIPDNILLPIFSISEIILALWLLWGKYLFYSSLLCAFALGGIVIFNFNQMDIVFRDVGLMFTAFALSVYSYKGKLNP